MTNFDIHIHCLKEKFDIACVANSNVQELMRCIRSQTESLIPGLNEKSMSVMSLGLAHGLSGYKLKYSPDKVCHIFRSSSKSIAYIIKFYSKKIFLDFICFYNHLKSTKHCKIPQG